MLTKNIFSKNAIVFRIIQKQMLQIISINITSLASAFNNLNTFSKIKENAETTGLFGIDLLSNPKGFQEFRDQSITYCNNLLEEALSNKRRRKMVQVFDELSNSLCKVADLSEFVRIAHPLPIFRKFAENASLAISSQVEKLNTNQSLYQSLYNVVKNDDIYPTDDVDKYVAKLFLQDFEQSGVHLNDKKRNLTLQINENLLILGASFVSNTSEARVFDKSQVPEAIKYFRLEGDKVIIDNPFSSSNHEFIREIGYKLYYSYNEKQDEILTDLLQSRHVLAKLCGFESFSQRSIIESIISSTSDVKLFIDVLSKHIKEFACRDYETMFKTKKKNDIFAKNLMPWDVSYYNSLIKEEKYNRILSSSLPYFSLGACMEGLAIIFNKLFGIRLNAIPSRPGEVWHWNIIKLEVLDENNEVLGHIFCDFFERKGKPHQDCHFTIRGGCTLPDKTYQNPIVVLLLNLPLTTESKPSLLSPFMVENLFHEMGHAIHSMLARTPYQHTTGTRCSTDLAEVPSILMENFCNDKRVVSCFAKHYKTGENMPSSLIDAWIDSKKLFHASEVQLQLFYSMLDQVYHSSDPLMGRDTTYVLSEVQEQYYGLPYVSETAWQLRFSHLVGYGSKYFSYLVSRAVSCLLWEKLFKENPLNKEAGNIYRKEVLSHGGSKPPLDIVQSVLGISITPLILSESLMKNISENYKI